MRRASGVQSPCCSLYKVCLSKFPLHLTGKSQDRGNRSRCKRKPPLPVEEKELASNRLLALQFPTFQSYSAAVAAVECNMILSPTPITPSVRIAALSPLR